jgi:hypothetical protein
MGISCCCGYEGELDKEVLLLFHEVEEDVDAV